MQNIADSRLTSREITELTASMWKYTPVPDNQPDKMPEYVFRTHDFTGGRLTGARVRGKMHKHNGTNCDDWFEFGTHEGIIFAALSDGAGSRKLSRVGARAACEAATGCISVSLRKLLNAKPSLKTLPALRITDPEFMQYPEDVRAVKFSEECAKVYGDFISLAQSAVMKAREAVEIAFLSRADKREYHELLGRYPDIRDFSSTFLLALLVPVGEGGNDRLAITCQIGDGMTALINTRADFTKALRLMGEADSGEFSGETDFLTSLTPEMLRRKTRIAITDADILLMMTDGVSDDYFPNSPQLIRLYFDLLINGVLDVPDDGPLNVSAGMMPLSVMRTLKRSIKPLAYPEVSERRREVPIQYTSRILSALCKLNNRYGLSGLWEDKRILRVMSNVIDDDVNNPAEVLKLWLDNYVVRGSGDDRTLIIGEFFSKEAVI